jgi:hypothetical protein
MEFEEIDVPEGLIQQIDPEGPLAGITDDVGNVDYIYPNVNVDVMRSLPKVLIHNWSSWKMVDEINMERARYLLSTDEMLEEMLNKAHG